MPADTTGRARRGHTYVIDRSYRVVFMDRLARRVFPEGRIGALCYECFRGASEPCRDCPWQPDSESSVNQTVVFSQRLDQWYEITCLELEWLDSGSCVLFSGRPADGKSRSLFATLSEPSSYDELLEINITENACKVLYAEPEKYVRPKMEGRLDVMFAEAADCMIHPEDRDRFVAFWDFDTLLERIDRAGGALRGEFRKRLCADGWGWVAQTIVSVKRGDGGETVVMCFVADIDEIVRVREAYDKNEEIRQLKERDRLTGLYNASTFYAKCGERVAGSPSTAFEIAYLDIEHFKLYNEWYGSEAGDAMLKTIAESIASLVRAHDGIAGYLGGDDFVMLLPQGSVSEAGIETLLQRQPLEAEDALGFQPVIGMCSLEAGGGSAITACDHAMLAMNSAKGNFAKRIARYEASMSEEMEDETKTLMEVRQALKNREFVLHWQPQCSTRTGRIVGLEALVRWQHPERGLVLPGAFIPVLEHAGFIANLDLYVWEEACRSIRSWVDRGGEAVPVSVNISRADLYAIDVVEALENLVERFGIERHLLELEITESAYAEDKRMAEAVNRLKELGFTILMDDFGSGYSSLNMLRDINVDVIKIDMDFLNREGNLQRGESILEAIVSMARLMDLRIIAEGAETEEQVEFLRSIGCDYAQGYYFYRPMSTEALEELLRDDALVDRRGVLSPVIESIDMDALIHEDDMGRTIVDNLIGGMAIYAVSDNRFELMQVNNEYYRVTGCNPVDLRERQRDIWKQVHSDDLDAVLSAFDEAERYPVTGAECTVRRYRLNGEIMWLKMRVYFLRRQEGRRLYYAAVEDATEQRQRELLALGSVTSDARVFEMLQTKAAHHWCVNLSQCRFLDARERELFADELGLRFDDWSAYEAADAIRAALRPVEDFRDAVDAFLDRDGMLAGFGSGTVTQSLEYLREGVGASPERRWTELCYHLLQLEEGGSAYAYLYLIDIDERKRRELRLADRAERDALTGLLNRHAASARIPDAFARTIGDGNTGAFVVIDLDDFKSVNDRYGHLYGDRVLSGIGQRLRSAFRKHDLIGRWGGDEFIVYCDDISNEDIARRVRSLCEEGWEADAGSNSAAIKLTVSAGIAMVPEHGTRFTSVYERADAALYQAKSKGRAQFRVYEAGMQPHIASTEK